jgi:hypothetical protein
MRSRGSRDVTRRAAVAAAAGLALAAPAHAEQWARTPYGGVAVVTFDKRETRRVFGVAGWATIAFDGYAAQPEAVLVLTTRRGPCVDSGKLDDSGPLPFIHLRGACHGIDGLVFGSVE